MPQNTIKTRFSAMSLRMRIMLASVACMMAALMATIGGSAANPPQPLQPQAATTAPRFQTYLSPPGTADSFGEPSIGANWLSGNIMAYGGFGNPVRVSFDECSSPAKATWVTTPTITTATARALGDPILFTDRDTGRTLVSQLEGGTKQSTTDYTEDDGASYHPTQGSGINSGVDHQTLGGGPFAPGAPSHSYQNAIYYCAQDVADANCALSLDGGVTFGPAIPIYNTTQCTGLHGHVKVAPNDGTVYVPNRGCGGNPVGTPVTARQYQGLAVSTDNGITWTVKPVTGTGPNSNDPSLGIASDGTLYFAYADADNHPKVKVSHNKGTTWSGGTSPGIDLGVPFGIKQTAFPVAVAGDANRAAVGFIGSPATGNPNTASTFKGIWHAYIAMTYDGGATWTTVDTTPDDPVQIGSICLSGTTCGTDRNLLDFNDMTVDKFGRALMIYADGCLAPGCTTATAAGTPPYNASRSSKAAIARQSGGPRLFAAYDPVEPVAPGAPRLSSANKDPYGVVHVTWSEPDNGGSPLTGYNIYRRTANGAYGAPLATISAASPSYDDTNADPTQEYFYKVTASNAVGEGTSCGELQVIPSSATETPCVAPGIVIARDAELDQTGSPQSDIQLLAVAELYEPALTANKLFFTLKVNNLNPIPQAEARWTIFFTRTNANGSSTEWFVSMVTDDTSNPGMPVYRYGHTTINATTGLRTLNTDGLADAGATTPDGKIVIQISRPTKTSTAATALDFPPLATGETLANINALTQQTIGVLLLTTDSSGSGGYTLVGNGACQPNAPPVADLSATPTSGYTPLTVNFDASASSDADAGDTIASYTFNFGDGSPAVTQSSPTVSHIYTAPGDFAARLSVKDSRGFISSNVAQKTISLIDSSIPVNYALSSNGGTAVGSSEYPNGGYPAASAINGDRTGGNWGNGPGGWNDGTRDQYPDWLEVDFSGAKTINEIRVFTLQDAFRNVAEPTPDMTCNFYGIQDFDVQYWDGSAWQTVPGGSVTGNDKVMRVFGFSAITTSKVRVVINSARAHYSRIVELEAFGAGGQ
jgi:PKD repeat protein